MNHTVTVNVDVATLRQLDDLRRASPTVPSRAQIITRLIWDAHAKIPAKELALQD